MSSGDSLLTNLRTRSDSVRTDQQSTGVRSIETLDTIMESGVVNISVDGSNSGSGSGSHKGTSRNNKCGCNSGKRGMFHIHDQITCVSTASPFAINASCDDLDLVSEKISLTFWLNFTELLLNSSN